MTLIPLWRSLNNEPTPSEDALKAFAEAIEKRVRHEIAEGIAVALVYGPLNSTMGLRYRQGAEYMGQRAHSIAMNATLKERV